jgi:hypothetical protein
MTQLKMLSIDDTIAEIRRLYFSAKKDTIQQDLEKALDLLKSLSKEEDRERATVYMEGLSEMRRDWTPKNKGKGGKPKGPNPQRAKSKGRRR